MDILAPAAIMDRGHFYDYRALCVSCICLQSVVTGFTKPSRMEASSCYSSFDIKEKDILCLLIVRQTNYSIERVAG